MSGPIGSNGSGFVGGSSGNIFHQIDCGNGFKLQERFDFKNLQSPCIDYDIPGVSHKTMQKLFGDDRHIPL